MQKYLVRLLLMTKITRRDMYIGAFAGSLIGLLFIPILNNFNYSIGIVVGIEIVIAFAAISGAGILVINSVSRIIPILGEFARFILVGVLNTVVDLGVLNFLI